MISSYTPTKAVSSSGERGRETESERHRERRVQGLEDCGTVCTMMSAAVYTVTLSTDLSCCFSAALQSPAPPLAHNFRMVSPATRVSAHGQQPTFPDESFCQYSHDPKERERERDDRA